MNEFDLPFKGRPEAKIQQQLEMFLKARNWYVKSTHGNAYQSGFPDIYAHHIQYRARWIEVKVTGHYQFTRAQLRDFPMMSAFGVGIWILTAATEDEYRKLWLPPNWSHYLPVNKVHSRRVNPKGHGYVPKYETPGLPKKDKK